MAGKRIGPPKRPDVEVTDSPISTLSGPWLMTSIRPLFERRAQNSRMTLSVPPRARAVTTNTYRMGWAGLTAALYRALRRSSGVRPPDPSVNVPSGPWGHRRGERPLLASRSPRDDLCPIPHAILEEP